MFNGVMIDISRGQIPGLKLLKKVIRILSEQNLNFISLYMEHTFPYEKHPIIWQGSGAYTKKDIKELINFAAKYNVEVIPSIQTLGHMEKILSHKEYAHLAETNLYNSLAPAVKDTYKLLEDMISEVAAVFPSEYINIGGDEVWDFASGKSKKYAAKIGGPTKLFLKHIIKVKEIADKYNKKIMMWSDMFLKYPEDVKLLPEDIIILNWDYSAGSVSYFKKLIKKLNNKKDTQIICPGASTWDTLFPEVNIAYENNKNFIEAAESFKNSVIGAMITTWGDDGNFNFLGESLPGFMFFFNILNRKRNPKKLAALFNTNYEPVNAFSFFATLYKKLGFENNYELFKIFWSEPFLNSVIFSENFNINNVKKLFSKASSFKKEIYNADIKINKCFFDELKYKINFNVELLRKIILLNDIDRLWLQAYSNMWNEQLVGVNLKKIIKIFQELIKSNNKLKNNYYKLWIRNYKREGLEYNIRKFNNLELAYKKHMNNVVKILKQYKKRGGSMVDVTGSFIRVLEQMNGKHPGDGAWF